MRFLIAQAAFARAVNTARKAVNSKQIMPHMKGIMLELKGSALSIHGTDLNTTIVEKLDVSGSQDGQALIGAKLLGDVVNKLPNSFVSVTTEGNTLTLSCLASEFTLACLNDTEYPVLPESESGASFGIRADNFRKLVAGTTYAASIDEKKGVLMGCLLEAGDGKATMVALDGFRMGIAKQAVEVDGAHKAIINAKDLNNVASILKEYDEAEAVIILSDSFAVFHIGTVTIMSRLLAGQYVRYADIIPQTHNTLIRVSKEDLRSALERANLFATSGKNNLVRLDIADGSMHITSRSDEGKVNETVEIEKEGADIVIGFNAKYLVDALKTIDDDEVSMEFTSPTSASLIRSVDGDAFTHLVLPVRLAATNA